MPHLPRPPEKDASEEVESASPMERFKTLARKLANVSQEELRQGEGSKPRRKTVGKSDHLTKERPTSDA